MSELDFLIAVGESFGDHVCPPCEDASPQDCCEALRRVLGFQLRREQFVGLSPDDHEAIATAFGSYFECTPPAAEKIAAAVSALLRRTT